LKEKDWFSLMMVSVYLWQAILTYQFHLMLLFFLSGFGTKTKGEQIRYKYQGSKLCFASNRFALITRCARESSWRHITVENPKKVLSSEYNIEPQSSSSPENILRKFLVNPDKRTKSILDHLNKNFFKSAFKKGTMIVIEGFEASEYEKYLTQSEKIR
jgi:hypothetical protein